MIGIAGTLSTINLDKTRIEAGLQKAGTDGPGFAKPTTICKFSHVTRSVVVICFPPNGICDHDPSNANLGRWHVFEE